MHSELLTDKELDDLSAELANWDVSADGLERSYDFGNFVKAFSFMAGTALSNGKEASLYAQKRSPAKPLSDEHERSCAAE